MTVITSHWLITMELAARLIQLRKHKGLSQQALADAMGLHVTQVKRYESGANQPSLEVLKRIAVTFGVTTDFLLFEDAERGPDDELRLQFDTITRLDEEEKRVIRELIDGMIIKYQSRRWDSSRNAAPTPAPAAKAAGKRQAASHR